MSTNANTGEVEEVVGRQRLWLLQWQRQRRQRQEQQNSGAGIKYYLWLMLYVAEQYYLANSGNILASFYHLHAQTNYLQDRYRYYLYLQISHPQIQFANKNLVIL